MGEPGHGIVGRESELARVESFIESVPEGPSALLLKGVAGIGKTTMWHAGVSMARARGHRVLACRTAESEARLSYAALLRAEFEGAPPDQRAVSVASLGVLRALAMSGPVGPHPAGGAAGPSPRPGAICRRHARRWSKPWSSTGSCRSPSSWPGPCW